MLILIEQLKTKTTIHFYQLLFLLTQITCLSGATVVLFDAIWSANIFLPLGMAIEILIKFLVVDVIERFIHHRYK